MACETALAIGKRQEEHGVLGSVVTVQGPLLSLPTSPNKANSTKILYVYRAKSNVISAKARADIAALQRAFSSVQTIGLPEKPGIVAAMPSNKAEWDGIMSFWSEHLQSSMAWQRQGEVYEVTGGRNFVALPKEVTSTVSPPGSAIHSASPNTAKTTSRAPAGFKRGFLSGGL